MHAHFKGIDRSYYSKCTLNNINYKHNEFISKVLCQCENEGTRRILNGVSIVNGRKHTVINRVNLSNRYYNG